MTNNFPTQNTEGRAQFFLPDLLALLFLLLGLLLVLNHLLQLVVGLQVLGLQLRRLNR